MMDKGPVGKVNMTQNCHGGLASASKEVGRLNRKLVPRKGDTYDNQPKLFSER